MLIPALLVVGIATGSATPSQLTPGHLPVPSLSGISRDLRNLFDGPDGADLPGQGTGRGVGAHSTKADAGSGHAPGKGVGQLATAGSGAPKPTAGTSAKISTGYNAETSKLDQKRTTATQTWYDNADGSVTEKLSQDPVNFENAQGQWQPIDSSLTANGPTAPSTVKDGKQTIKGSSSAAGWHNAAAGFSLTLAGRGAGGGGGSSPGAAAVRMHQVADGVTPAPSASASATASASPSPVSTVLANPSASASPGMSDGSAGSSSALVSLTIGSGRSVAWSLQGAANVAGTASGSSVTYPGILPDTNLVETSESYGVQEIFQLQSAGAPDSFTFPLAMTGVSLTQDASSGQWELVDGSGTVVAQLLAPWAQDSGTTGPGGNGAYASGVTYSLATVGGVEQLTLTVPQSWLRDPARVFPVTVDPTVQQLYMTGPGGDWSTYVNTSCDVGCQENTTGQLRAVDGWSSYSAYSVLNIPSNGLLGSGFHISQAQFAAYMTIDGNSADQDYYVEPIDSDWDPDDVPWPGPALDQAIGEYTGDTLSKSCSVIGGANSAQQWTYANLSTTYFQNLALGSLGYDGLAMFPSTGINVGNLNEQGTNDYFSSSINSGCSPYVLIDYTEDTPATVSSPSPVSGASVSTLTPTLSASATDPDPYPGVGLQYEFIVDSTAGTQLAESPVQTSTTWTVPSGVLKWGQSYVWTMLAYDGSQWSQPDSSDFSIVAPPPILGGTLSQDTNGHGFNAATGDYTTSATDAQLATVGPALEVQRNYNSLYPNASGGFGQDWSTETDAGVTQVLDASGNLTEAVVTYPDGEQVAFGLDGDGTYAPPQGRFATLTYALGTGYTLIDKDDTEYVFGHTITAPVTGSGTSNVAGAFGLSQVLDAQGRALNYGWSASTGGQVTSETSAVSGRSLSFTWTKPSGATYLHITQVSTNDATAGTGSTAQVWSYGYTGDELTSVCAPSAAAPATPSAACTGYSYENGSDYQQAVLNSDAQQYWPLDDASGSAGAATNVIANSGNGAITYSNVSLGNAGSPLSGSTATVASFNGTSSVAKTTASGVLDTAGAFSVAAWARMSAASGFEDVVSQDSSENSSFELQYDATTGGWAFSRTTADAAGASSVKATASGTVTPGQWYFLVGTYVPGSGLLSLYVNGAPAGSAVVPSVYSGSGPVVVGRCQFGGTDECYFDGGVSDVALFDNALTATQVSQLYQIGAHPAALLTEITRPNAHTNSSEAPASAISYNLATGWVTQVTDGDGGAWDISAPAGAASSYVYREAVMAYGPQHYWTFGDSAGSAAAGDAVNNDLTTFGSTTGDALYNNVSLGSASSEFTGFTAAGLNGSNSYIELPPGTFASPSTIGLWFKTTGTNQMLIGTGNAAMTASGQTGYDPLLYVGGDGNLVAGLLTNSGVQSLESKGAVNDGAWHYVVLSFGSTGSTQPPVQVCADAEATVPAASPSPTASPSPCPDASASPSASSTPQDVSLYLDGSQVGTGNWPMSSVGYSDVWLGAGWTSGCYADTPGACAAPSAEYMTGDLADVSVYRSALSGSDVSGLWGSYEKTAPQSYVDPAEAVTVTQPADTLSGKAQTDTYLYDPSNGMRLIRYTNALGETTQYGYDVDGFLDTTTDANGDEAIQGHDARGNVVSSTTCQNQQANACSTSYSGYYLDPGSQTDPRNDLQAWSSDGRSASATDTTYRTTYAYDASGNLLTTTDPLGHVTTNVYTTGTSAFPSCDQPATPAPAGLLATTTTAGGAVTSYTYYADGDTCTVTNAIGQVTDFTYDGLGRVVSKTVGHQIVGDWPLTQTSGTSVPDSSGLGNTAAASNVAWSGGAASFNGTSSQITAGDQVLNTAASYSVSAWVELSSIPSTYAVVATVPGPNDNAMFLLLSTDKNWVFQTTASDVSYTTETYYTAADPATATTGTWYHLVGVYDASAGTDSLYVNGSLVGETPAPQSWAASGPFTLGSNGSGLFYFPGSIGDAQAYQRVLTSGQVSALYAEGQHGAPAADPSTDDLVTSYTYDGDGRVSTQTYPATTDAVTGDVHTPKTSYTYDADGDVLSTTVSDTTGGDYSRETTNTYNNFDEQASSTAPEGNVSTNDQGSSIPANQDGQHHTTDYTYDAYGNVETTTDPQNRTAEVLYDAGGNKREQLELNTAENGTADAGVNLVQEEWTYDPGGRLSTQVDDPNGLDHTTEYSYYDNNEAYQAIRTDGEGDSYVESTSTYDGAGDLTSQVTNNGATTTAYTYDADKRKSSVTVDPTGVDRVTNYTYSTDGYVTSTVTTGYVQLSATSSTPNGIVADATATYDALGDETSQSVIDGSTTRTTSYELDQRGLPMWETDPAGNVTYTTYDADGRLVESQSPPVTATVASASTGQATTAQAYAITTTGYDTFGDVVEQEGPDSADAGGPTSSATSDSTVYGYDADGLQVSQTQPSYTAPGASSPTPSESTTQYDGDGEPITSTDPIAYASSAGGTVQPTAGEVVTDQYTNLGQVSAQSAQDMATGAKQNASATYNALGETMSSTAPTGAQAATTYDYLGRTLTSSVVDRYGGANDATSETDTTTDAYTTSSSDPGGWLSSQTTQGGVTTSYTYDSVGEQLTSTDPAHNTTSAVYDGAGRAVKTVQPDRMYALTLYDEGGLTSSAGEYDANNNQLSAQSYGYDLDGDKTSSTLLQSAANRSISPSSSNTITYGADPTTTFDYDATGLLTSETQPVSASPASSVTVSYGYDLAGNETKYQDGNLNNTYTTYNTWGLPQTTIEPPVSTSTYTYDTLANEESTDAYDADGDLTQTTEPGGVTLGYRYDGFGDLTQQTGSGATAATATRTFGYNLDGAVTSASTSAAGSSSATSESFAYDDRGLLTSATGSAGNSAFTYTRDGLMASRADASGTSSYTYDGDDRLQDDTDSSTGTTLAFAYNNESQPSSITYGTGGDIRSLGYNAAGEVTSDTLTDAASTVVDRVDYGYDDAGELTSKTDTAGTSNSYTYDEAGRLVEWNSSTASSPTYYAYDADSNRTQVGSNIYTYDARDELTSDGTNTYTYSANGELSQISKSTTSGNVNTTYTDDAYGQQITAGSENYTYDASDRDLVEANGTQTTDLEYSGAGNDVAQAGFETYSRDASGDLIGQNTAPGQGPGSGTGTAANPTPADGDLLWTDLHTDVVGAFTPTATTMAGTETYDPLGNVLTNTGATRTVNLGYQSEFTSTATGEVNMDARWYNPATGQFLNKDSADNSATPDTANANPFAYAGGDPLTNVDPDGHMMMPVVPVGEDAQGNLMYGAPAQEQVESIVDNDAATVLGWGDDPATTAEAIATIRNVVQDNIEVKDAAANPISVKLSFGGRFISGPDGLPVISTPTVSNVWAANSQLSSDQDYLNALLALMATQPKQVTVPPNSNLCGRIGGADCNSTTTEVMPQRQGSWTDFLAGLGQSFIGTLGMVTPGGSLPISWVYNKVINAAGIDENSVKFHDGSTTGMLGQIVGGALIDPMESLFGEADGALDGAVNDGLDSSLADASSAAEAAANAGSAAEGAGGAGSGLDNFNSDEDLMNGEAPSPSESQVAGQQNDVSPPPPSDTSASGGDDAGNSGGNNEPPCSSAPKSFTGQTPVLMAGGSTKPIDQIEVGDQIENAVPGQSGTQANTVTNVITTYTDRDFVDVTVAPTSTTTTLTDVLPAQTTATTDSDATSGGKAASAGATSAEQQVATAEPGTHWASRIPLLMAAGLTALALASSAAPSTNGISHAATPAWSESTAAPSANSQDLARQATADATSAAESVGGGTITTTFLHPFYDITQTSFVEAQDLHVGDLLQTSTGPAQVTNLHLFHADTTTYDLTIGALHTFYVLAGSIAVLVHNCDSVGQIPYNSDELSSAAYQARVKAGISPGRNVAVARVPGWNDPETGDLVVGFSKGGGYHAEDHIMDQLAGRGFDPEQITGLYSDRQPCPVCGPMLDGPLGALSPGTPISWAVPWGSDPMINSGSNELLRQMILRQSGR